MATPTVIQGRLLKVYINDVVLENQLDSTIDIQSDMDETTSKNSGSWKTYLPSWIGGTASVSAYLKWDSVVEGASQALGYVKNGTLITIMFSTEVTGDKSYSANAYVSSWSMSAAKDGISQLTFNYQITGEVTEATV